MNELQKDINIFLILCRFSMLKNVLIRIIII